jgi:hypothetical protein
VSPAFRSVLVIVLLLPGARALVAQGAPTLPSDTLVANYGPRSAPAPTPGISPTLPSDTLAATQPVDSFPTDPSDGAAGGIEEAPEDSLGPAPQSPADSFAPRESPSGIERHPGVGAPPPVRAVLVRT